MFEARHGVVLSSFEMISSCQSQDTRQFTGIGIASAETVATLYNCRNPVARAVLILLRGTATDAAGSLDDTIAQDRYSAPGP